MKKLVAIAAAVAVGLAGCGSGSDNTTNTTDTTEGEKRVAHDADRKALERLEREQTEAWARDGAAYAATFTDDADFVDVMGGHLHGRAALAKSLQQGFDTFMANTRLSASEKRTVKFISPDVAVVITSGNCVLGPGVKECRAEDLSIQTKVAVRQNGKWLFRTFQNTRIRG